MHFWTWLTFFGTLLHLTLSFVLLLQCCMRFKISRATKSRTINSIRNLLTNLGTFQMAIPTPQTLFLWYTVDYEDVPPNSGRNPFAIEVPSPMTTTVFLHFLKSANPNSIGICDHMDLKVFRTVTDFATKADALNWKDDVSALGKD
jgi:hypothetical protein